MATTTQLATVRQALKDAADPERAVLLQSYFKTGPGEYGAGDRFLGLRVPQIRALVKRFRDLPLAQTEELLHSGLHEERLLALLLLVQAYQAGDAAQRQCIYELYLANTRWINNWDLVDSSAEYIVGAHLQERDRAPLWALAQSAALWERRIAVLATFHFLRNREFSPTLRVARMLLNDREDLIHKAVGWMLREIGKRDVTVLEAFLEQHRHRMPRTMLRYAIERFPEAKRRRYLER
jgi:3-methyladenine DNA glycosylase AlkD